MKPQFDSASLPSVAIVGRPNVGKSALFNRLVGRNVAIVHDQPGITRDRISGISKRGPRPFAVWDTGGIVGSGETQLTAEVREVVDEAVRVSDVLLFVVDAKAGLSPIDEELARTLRKSRKPILLVVNKIDNVQSENFDTEFSKLGLSEAISISAAHGRGIDDLLEHIAPLLPAALPEVDQPSTISHQLSLAIVGKPNAGKSSLINSILKSERAIVSDIPGTTRDAVDISYERDGERFLIIDTAGIRARSKHSSSVEIFSVMRAERTIRRADLCVLVVDATSGVTSQDKKIASLIQQARKACIIVINKWDLVKPARGSTAFVEKIVEQTREQLFFLPYAPVLVASAKTGEHVDRLFRLIAKVRGAGKKRIGTGVLNRTLRAAFDANPPPMVSGKRLKLFYAAQGSGAGDRHPLGAPEIVLFVNQPKLLGQTYARYLEAQIRSREPYTGLPLILKLRPRSETERE